MKIPDKNCLTYKNIEGTWKCVECFDKYYIDNNNICKVFPDKNCKSYRVDEGTFICESCENGYYLDNNRCIYYYVTNCSGYDGTKCSSCVNGYMLNKEQNICVNTCKSTEKICSICHPFYGSFDSGQTCKLLGSDVKDDKVDKIVIDDKGKFININLILILWLLILIS